MQTETRTVESQRSSEACELFLRGATRESTRRVGAWLWARLVDQPQGAPINVSQVGRELGYSRLTVRRALEVFTRWGRLLRVTDYATGDHPGRPAAYRLHPALLKADRVCISALPGNSPRTPYSKTRRSQNCTAAHFETDPSPSPTCQSAQMPTQSEETTKRTLREVVRDRRRIAIRAGHGSVARTLAALRDALGSWTGPRLQAAGVCPDDPLLAPSDFAMDLRREIQTAFAVALWRKFRQGTYLAAWNSAHDDLIATIAAMPESGERLRELAGGERGKRELHAFIGYIVEEVFAPRQRQVQDELSRLAGEEARLRERITCDQDRLSDAQAREILARARGQREAARGGEGDPVPAEPRPPTVAFPRRVHPPIRDPEDLKRRRAELLARLEGGGHGQR